MPSLDKVRAISDRSGGTLRATEWEALEQHFESPYDDESKAGLRFALTRVWATVLRSNKGFAHVKPYFDRVEIEEANRTLRAYLERGEYSVAGHRKRFVPERLRISSGDQTGAFMSRLQATAEILADNPEYKELWRRGRVPEQFSNYKLRCDSEGTSSAWRFRPPWSEAESDLVQLQGDQHNDDRLIIPSLTDEELTHLAQKFEAPNDTPEHSKLRLQVESALASVLGDAHVGWRGADATAIPQPAFEQFRANLLECTQNPSSDTIYRSMGWKIPFPELRKNEGLTDHLKRLSYGLLGNMADHEAYEGLRRAPTSCSDLTDIHPV